MQARVRCSKLRVFILRDPAHQSQVSCGRFSSVWRGFLRVCLSIGITGKNQWKRSGLGRDMRRGERRKYRCIWNAPLRHCHICLYLSSADFTALFSGVRESVVWQIVVLFFRMLPAALRVIVSHTILPVGGMLRRVEIFTDFFKTLLDLIHLSSCSSIVF